MDSSKNFVYNFSIMVETRVIKPLTAPLTSTLAAQSIQPRMSDDDFARWHVNDMLFVRRVSLPTGDGFAVYGADGTFLDVVESMGEVIISANKHDMEVAAVH